MSPFLMAALALANLLGASLHFSNAGAAQPAPVSNAISAIIALLGDASNFEKPDSITAILNDLVAGLKLANAVIPEAANSSLSQVTALLTASQTELANLASGQIAVLPTVSMSFAGKEVKVDTFAIRDDSQSQVLTDIKTDLGL
jgi:hypothetical protein